MRLMMLHAMEFCRKLRGIEIESRSESFGYAREFHEYLGAFARGHHLIAHARRQIARDHRHQREEEKRNDIFAVADRERVERRQKEKIVGQHADETGEERGPQSVGNRTDKNGRQEYERDVRHGERLLQDQPDRDGRSDHAQTADEGIGPPWGSSGGALLVFLPALRFRLFLRHDMDAEIARAADDLVGGGGANEFEPARPARRRCE